MSAQRTRLLPRESITLADLAPCLNLDLEGTYALLKSCGIRAKARPTTRISRVDAKLLKEARSNAIERQMRDAGFRAPRENPAVRKARAALGDTSPAAVSNEDAEAAALARQWGVAGWGCGHASHSS